MSGTPIILEWYINFQATVLKQLPRPDQIDQEIAEGWTDNQVSLKRALAECLLPPILKQTSSWTERDGVIYFCVTSDGTTGPEWITRLEEKGFRLDKHSKSVMMSSDFKPTNGVTTKIAVLKGMLFSNEGRTTSKIRDYAKTRNLTKPGAEVACLIREKFTDEEIKDMDLWWIVTMHEPIKDFEGDSCILSAFRLVGGCRFNAYEDKPDIGLYCLNGFAFAVSQVSSQT